MNALQAIHYHKEMVGDRLYFAVLGQNVVFWSVNVFFVLNGSWLTFNINYILHRHSYVHNWTYSFRNIGEK